MCSVGYTANEYSIYHFCIIMKDFSITFSRVIIVQDLETVFFNVLFVYKPTFSAQDGQTNVNHLHLPDSIEIASLEGLTL